MRWKVAGRARFCECGDNGLAQGAIAAGDDDVAAVQIGHGLARTGDWADCAAGMSFQLTIALKIRLNSPWFCHR